MSVFVCRARWTKAMPLHRTSLSVAIGLLFCLSAAPALGQGPLGYQIFAPADLSTYGGDIEPNEGYFFQFDGLYWSISQPELHQIGFNSSRIVWYSPSESDTREEHNTWDTSVISSQWGPGNRIEFGRIENRDGWFVSIYQLRDQDQATILSGGSIVFNDPAVGIHGETLLQGNVNNDATQAVPYDPAVFKNLPVVFRNVLLENEVKTWGVEANYLHRFLTRHEGGTFEMFMGARYFEFNDRFTVQTSVDPDAHNQPVTVGNVDSGLTTLNAGVPSFLGGSSWNTVANNHVVGPQIGLRWFIKRGRWTFSTEGRFMAGLNLQSIEQQVDMGPNLSPGPQTVVTVNPATGDTSYNYVYQPFEPRAMQHTTATHVEYSREWAPAYELRIEGRYQLTRAIQFHAGWTGMWMDGVARASSLINYTVPAMGINMADNREGVLLNGLTLGFDVNR
jgi:hypothetical protein